MGDRAGRAARTAVRVENQANVDVHVDVHVDVYVNIRRDVDGGQSESGSSDGEFLERVVESASWEVSTTCCSSAFGLWIRECG